MGESPGCTAPAKDEVAVEDVEGRAASEAAEVPPEGATLPEGPGATVALATVATTAVATETKKGKPYHPSVLWPLKLVYIKIIMRMNVQKCPLVT
jgi:hypothetical protein